MIAVVDTNVLLHEEAKVKLLMYKSWLQVVVPAVVISELDRMKNDRKIGSRARFASAMLLETTSARDSNIRLQKYAESLAVAPLLGAGSGDDRILQCCLYFRSTSSTRVVLLTRDNNLALLAVSHGIQVASDVSAFAAFPAKMMQHAPS